MVMFHEAGTVKQVPAFLAPNDAATGKVENFFTSIPTHHDAPRPRPPMYIPCSTSCSSMSFPLLQPRILVDSPLSPSLSPTSPRLTSPFTPSLVVLETLRTEQVPASSAQPHPGLQARDDLPSGLSIQSMNGGAPVDPSILCDLER
ncbi:hypothetical protein GQ607_007425 [Colletotrichum asianum]|uniref:Uncharacterized protein n=1 Tax=Colletotrichum asianum TaxID=702518 RepID=A0A8H3ZT66_9PEZI|nr:hypothetical protein GQ607_007425 [Colletotrichum asianum]